VVRLGIDVLIQPSSKRVFPDKHYEAAGAVVTEDLSAANAIFGVKQVPKENLLAGKTYLFFSHTIKAQLDNMALLDALRAKNVRLIDYECITREGKAGAPRLVAFGEYAGRAGMIDSLRGVGQQLLYKGLSSSLLSVGSTYMYPSYVSAAEAVKRAGAAFHEATVGEARSAFNPLVFVFTGTGNVNRGARQVFNLLPHTWVPPEHFAEFAARELGPGGAVQSPIVGCQVEIQHMVERVADGGFDKKEFYAQPELYRSTFFDKFARHCNVLVNGLYWDARYPRVVCKGDLKRAALERSSRLHFIADISCDPNGGIESLAAATKLDSPFVSVADPPEASDVMLMGVDILPSELPREASQHFGDYLLPFVEPLAAGRATEELPAELRGACITDAGHLRERFAYIEKMRHEKLRALNGLPASAPGEQTATQLAGSSVVRLDGHLFDTGLINKMLDVVEERRGRFHILQCLVGPSRKSSVLLQITMDEGRAQLDEVLAEFRALAADARFAKAEADMEELSDFCKGNFTATVTQQRQIQHQQLTELREDRRRKAEKDSHQNARPLPPSAARLPPGSPDAPLSWAPLQTVAVLGAGMVAKPCVELLSRDTSRNVVLCSHLLEEAEGVARKLARSNVQPVRLDAGRDAEALDRLVARCDAVVSLLPAALHAEVAKLCIRHRVPLVTASYVTPEMQALEPAARDAGVPILCEMGLDPGMDHMSAMQVVDQIHEAGGQVRSFSSVCGGLTAPEAANNPFGYKFSWSPLGVMNAMKNPARFLREGRRHDVPGGVPLMEAALPFRMHQLPSLALEVLPNRDSLHYTDKYGVPEATTEMFRGTLRYQGFAAIFAEVLRNGLADGKDTFATAHKRFRASTKPAHPAAAAIEWLLEGEKLSPQQLAAPANETLASVLTRRLALQPGDRDLCLMQHTFNGGEQVSTLLAYGDANDTGMAKTVGFSAAIGARLFLDLASPLHGAKGILLPTEKRIYEPVLQRLAKEGIVFNHFHRKH
jgi:alpha-aminoadipic semialdehyde synthase